MRVIQAHPLMIFVLLFAGCQQGRQLDSRSPENTQHKAKRAQQPAAPVPLKISYETATAQSLKRLSRKGAQRLAVNAYFADISLDPKTGKSEFVFHQWADPCDPTMGSVAWYGLRVPDGTITKTRIGGGIGLRLLRRKDGYHAFYWQNSKVIHAFPDGARWRKQEITSGKISEFDDSDQMAPEGVFSGGELLDFQVDGLNQVHLAFYKEESNWHRLKHATYAAGKWTSTTLQSSATAPENSQILMVVDPVGTIHIIHRFTDRQPLRLATRHKGQRQWKITSVPNSIKTVLTMEIIDDQILLAAIGGKPVSLYYMTKPVNGKWKMEKILPLTDEHRVRRELIDYSVVQSPDGQIHIVAAFGGAIYYMTKPINGKWAASKIMSSPAAEPPLDNSIALDLVVSPSNQAHVIFSDGSVIRHGMPSADGWRVKVLDRADAMARVKGGILTCDPEPGPKSCFRTEEIHPNCFAVDAKQRLHLIYTLEEQFTYESAKSKPPMFDTVLLYRTFDIGTNALPPAINPP